MDVVVQLFQWQYADIAKECCSYLGPHNYSAVQVSPIFEQRLGREWYMSYQPVSYKIDNRLGNESAFKAMCDQCRACSVDVIVDVVANHMAEGSGTGSAGSSYGTRTYKGLYQPEHFHHINGDTTYNCGINDDRDAYQVQNCDLLGLPDLDTSNAYVRSTLAHQLARIATLGVTGVRIDAAKHIPASDVTSILALAESSSASFRYTDVVQEVILDPFSDAALKPQAYVGNGRVTEFSYSWDVAYAFRDSNLRRLRTLGSTTGLYSHLLPSLQVLVFIDNHDSQRVDDARLTYEDGMLYAAATAFMLAWNYGRPRVMSSYKMELDSSNGEHFSVPISCDGVDWICEHRWPLIGPLVQWRAAAAGQPIDNWQDGGTTGQIAFSRGAAAFIAFSLPVGSEWIATLQTGLPPGTYCNIVADDACATTVHVGASGSAQVHVGELGVPVVALHINAAINNISPTLTVANFSIGGLADFRLIGGLPSAPVFFLYSLEGTSPTPVPALGVTLGLKKPREVGDRGEIVADGAGAATWRFRIPANLQAGRWTVWMQAAQRGTTTNVIQHSLM